MLAESVGGLYVGVVDCGIEGDGWRAEGVVVFEGDGDGKETVFVEGAFGANDACVYHESFGFGGVVAEEADVGFGILVELPDLFLDPHAFVHWIDLIFMD